MAMSALCFHVHNTQQNHRLEEWSTQRHHLGSHMSIRQHVNTPLVWDLHCTSFFYLNASTWSSNANWHCRLFFWYRRIIKVDGDELLLTILPLWCLMVIEHLFLVSWLHGVYWIPLVFYCSFLHAEIDPSLKSIFVIPHYYNIFFHYISTTNNIST